MRTVKSFFELVAVIMAFPFLVIRETWKSYKFYNKLLKLLKEKNGPEQN
jgi:preprotein translocase subunit YajC